jgi:hypothetical protein
VDESAEVGRQRRAEAVHAAQVLRLAAAIDERLTRRVAGERHDAAHGVADDVRGVVGGVGAGLAEGRDGDHHQLGPLVAEVDRIKAKGGKRAGRAVLDNDVGGQCEAAEVGGYASTGAAPECRFALRESTGGLRSGRHRHKQRQQVAKAANAAANFEDADAGKEDRSRG